jgi:hypothetical protein
MMKKVASSQMGITKKIKIFSENISIDFLKPIPAIKEIPDWYKGIPSVRNQDLTIKKCVPVLDSFGAGYLFRTSADVYYDSETQRFVDNGVDMQISSHSDEQVNGFGINDLFQPHPYKWVNRFFWQTPKGYSTLFTHPLNREDLPFHSISAVVDTDDFPLSVQFPFFIKKDFTGLIPAGTPIIQAIPFKRDNWELESPDQKESYEYKEFWRWFEPPMAKYKKNFWKRKSYR